MNSKNGHRHDYIVSHESLPPRFRNQVPSAEDRIEADHAAFEADYVHPPRLPSGRNGDGLRNDRISSHSRGHSAPFSWGKAMRNTRENKREGWFEFFAALVLAAAVLAALYTFLLVVHNTPLGHLFLKRGWVQYAVVFLGVFALAKLAVRWAYLWAQERAFRLDLLPFELGETITSQNASEFQSYLSNFGLDGKSRLVNRLHSVLAQFVARKNVSEMASYIESQSEADFAKLNSSYGSLNLIVWALPIFGFLGTVLGISQAVGDFSGAINGAGDMDVIKKSLGGVTMGLALSFDTTLLALVFSMIVMFPKVAVSKREERLLTNIDRYCHDELCRRLEDDLQINKNGDNDFIEAFDFVLNRYQQQWQNQTEAMTKGLAESLSASLGKCMQDSIKETQNSNNLAINRLNAELASHAESSQQQNSRLLDELRNLTSKTAIENREICERLARLQDKNFAQVAEILVDIQSAAGVIKGSFDLIEPICSETSVRLHTLIEDQQEFVTSASKHIRRLYALGAKVGDDLEAASSRLGNINRFELPESVEQTMKGLCRNSVAVVKELQALNHRLPKPNFYASQLWNWVTRPFKASPASPHAFHKENAR